MKTENSELLSLTFQPLHMERKLFMSFTAGFAFDLASGRPLEPGAAYAAAMGALAPGDCLDLGVPKKEAECCSQAPPSFRKARPRKAPS